LLLQNGSVVGKGWKRAFFLKKKECVANKAMGIRSHIKLRNSYFLAIS